MIINKTKNTTIANVIYLADTPLKRMKGLLGRKSLGILEAMVIKPCNSIHTLFMHFKIDVLFIDKNNRVIMGIVNMPPFRLSPIYLTSKFVVELPAGTIQSTNTTKGDQIAIE